MLILNRSEIESRIDFSSAARAIEDAYRAVSEGRVNLPPVGYIKLPEHGGDCHVKYGHIEGDDNFVIKIAAGFPGNEALGLANNSGVVVVMSAKTGAAVAVLHDEMVMTDIRTGIGGAIASRLLARADARNVAIIGTGVQARRQVEAHVALLGADLEFHVWGRSLEKAAQAAGEISRFANITVADDLASACRNADVIVTITAASTPIVKREWVRPGTHITAVGADAPGKQELATSLVGAADKLFCDLKSQCIDHGELAIPAAAAKIDPDEVTEIGDVLIDSRKGRTADSQITICDLTGLAVQDIAMANVVLRGQSELH